MSRELCLNCFRIKGEYAVCPYCGYQEGAQTNITFQLPPGTILKERYIIGERLGYGGFGITYRGYDTVLGIVVAIKEFYPAGLVNRPAGEEKVGVFSGSKAEDYKKQLGRFLEEARHMAMFAQEKDIVNVFTFFEENGTAYIIMEYVDGILLKKQLREKGKMEEKQACLYMDSILCALQKIHNKKIVHRDISPDNIFLKGEQQIKIFDFGAAKFQEGDSEKDMPAVVKTGYAPPEQYRSKAAVDNRIDIYAAGAVLYEMLTGEKPIESLERLDEDRLELPSQKGIQVDPAVEKALVKALALKPGDRYESAEEFRQALREK